jgi:citrate synthase
MEFLQSVHMWGDGEDLLISSFVLGRVTGWLAAHGVIAFNNGTAQV